MHSFRKRLVYELIYMYTYMYMGRRFVCCTFIRAQCSGGSASTRELIMLCQLDIRFRQLTYIYMYMYIYVISYKRTDYYICVYK